MIKLKGIVIFTLLLGMFGHTLQSQLYFGLPASSDKHPKVLDESKEIMANPWTGGMNSCQFGQVDMDLDGIKDLFVFDRNGDRIMTFLNGGTLNTVDYTYAPEFIDHFPELYDWVILKDYNNDGKEDIFTYSGEFPGIIVYKNISASTLEFELEVYPFITSFQGGGYVNILTTDVDYPGIEDIDSDGDLDILVFWGLGSFVEYHQNQSMELYGIPDSLIFMEVTQCWGRFAESDESNTIYLDTCMGESSSGVRHTGSTFQLLDLDADGDKDLLLGDVDYPNLIQLINGGDPDSAFMISQDPDFPSYNKSVNLFSMPAAAYIDVNNNQVNDLILSPFDPSLITSANYRSVWLYDNEGATNNPEFNFIQQDFLQEDMIDLGSGAYPVLEDYDGDGLKDLFVSNFGYYMYSFYDQSMILHSVYWSNIALFKNTGTANEPEFTWVTHDFANLHQLHLTGIYTTFGDLDNDGDKDMVLGRRDGSLVFLENIAGPGNPMEFGDPLFNYQDIQIGEYSSPQLFDLNQDGLLDLAIGEMNGNLNYYNNEGSLQQANFQYVTDSLGGVNVTDYSLSYTGFSAPGFFENILGEIELLVGSEKGKLYYFQNISGNLDGEFVESDSLFVLLGESAFDLYNGIRTGAAIGELTGDEYYELIVGNYSGGMHFYAGSAPPPVSSVKDRSGESKVLIFPNPAMDYFEILTPSNSLVLSVEMYDIYGKLLITKKFTPKQKVGIHVDGFAPGTYFVKIKLDSSPNHFVAKKLIIDSR